jgi:hypothetical protein
MMMSRSKDAVQYVQAYVKTINLRQILSQAISLGKILGWNLVICNATL